eukprot:NODE_5308_length_692_cov_22.197512_g4934_i0.p1 GENE.NODE_5308_length_692_cov_22.197512_g4934_i0~~NODE_5308_length_692_cov_22.197512_g4934_i0.p1  ORF type:complete len:131 (+),score=9.95 NODE_5308_length_692_cov_22.197512_g4934_i0:187-579(+)
MKQLTSPFVDFVNVCADCVVSANCVDPLLVMLADGSSCSSTHHNVAVWKPAGLHLLSRYCIQAQSRVRLAEPPWRRSPSCSNKGRRAPRQATPPLLEVFGLIEVDSLTVERPERPVFPARNLTNNLVDED